MCLVLFIICHAAKKYFLSFKLNMMNKLLDLRVIKNFFIISGPIFMKQWKNGKPQIPNKISDFWLPSFFDNCTQNSIADSSLKIFVVENEIDLLNSHILLMGNKNRIVQLHVILFFCEFLHHIKCILYCQIYHLLDI